MSPEPAHMFRLPGMAGMGKSTIARTVAAECRNSKSLTGNFSLGASFFFDEKEKSQNNAARLFPTLCRSLAECLPQLKADIVESIGNDKDFANGSLSDQWEKLILNPISKLEEENHPLPLTLVVVIDALGECKPRRDDMDDVHTVVNLIAKAHILKVIRLNSSSLAGQKHISIQPSNPSPTPFFANMKSRKYSRTLAAEIVKTTLLDG